jgi:hypothetical protein
LLIVDDCVINEREFGVYLLLALIKKMLNEYEFLDRPVHVSESVVSERCIEVILEEEIIVPDVFI